MVIEGVAQKRAMTIKQSCQRSPILVAEQQDGSWENEGPGGRETDQLTEAVAMGKARRRGACAAHGEAETTIGRGLREHVFQPGTWRRVVLLKHHHEQQSKQLKFRATDLCARPCCRHFCYSAQLILTASLRINTIFIPSILQMRMLRHKG